MRRIINDQYILEIGPNRHGQSIVSLWQTHGKMDNGNLLEYDPKKFVKSWTFTSRYEVTDEDILHEIELNDWSRWNKELFPGQKVEINEGIYYDLLGAVPPRNMNGSYFEVGEIHHHENGVPVYRACWMEDGKYYTGYPKKN